MPAPSPARRRTTSRWSARRRWRAGARCTGSASTATRSRGARATAIFQPVPCMHCENAPCELVCPVGATVHDSEGLNVQVYNRCVGTRFCSNNCPYKVRRFNFLQYSERDTPSLKAMHNPDVTVRARGVMEKCTYCLQRITRRAAPVRANRHARSPTATWSRACQSACPTSAIHFGDLNDPTARCRGPRPRRATTRCWGNSTRGRAPPTWHAWSRGPANGTRTLSQRAARSDASEAPRLGLCQHHRQDRRPGADPPGGLAAGASPSGARRRPRSDSWQPSPTC